MLLGMALATTAHAETFRLPRNGDNVVGSTNLTTLSANDSVIDLYMLYDQGYDEMRMANPKVNPFAMIKDGTELLIPSQYVLPDTPHEGIVINVAEMRLYYYPKPKKNEPQVVITHPISIGRENWTTPYGVTKVIAKIKDPAWVPPKSIREEHLREYDEVLPAVVKPGPDNPMGQFALKLGIPGYYIHGTDEEKEEGIGMRVTHGCIRLYPKDIATLFAQVDKGTPVRIVNQPYKVGWLEGGLYLEAHPRLEEDPAARADQYEQAVDTLTATVRKRRVEINWIQVRSAIDTRNGVPVMIGRSVASEPDPSLKADVQKTPPSSNQAVQTGAVW
ncbi:MAG TPA: L,D-transpeptidase family protein [Gammaproteobacteria bacterium]|nr:L,D-transpeptidase family protein [Gammaproteobacteria bacterium]